MIRHGQIIVKKLHYPGMGKDVFHCIYRELEIRQVKQLRADGRRLTYKSSLLDTRWGFMMRAMRSSSGGEVVVEEQPCQTLISFSLRVHWCWLLVAVLFFASCATYFALERGSCTLYLTMPFMLLALAFFIGAVTDTFMWLMRKCVKKVAAEHGRNGQ